MQSVDVIFLYEHVARELDIACAIKCIAEQHYGTTIELVHYACGAYQAVDQFRPRVVVLPFCYTEREYYPYLLKWRNAIYFNLNWEQMLYRGNREAKTPRGVFAREHVLHHAWSNHFADYLQQKGIPKQHIVVNGNPAYMLYEKPYRSYFKQRADLAAEYRLDPKKRWIFFPENYNWAFYPDEKLQSFISQGQDPQDVCAMRDFCRLSLEEVMKWCNAVASQGDVELIIRPRPATPLNDFKSAVRQVVPVISDSMHFVKEESVREWIMASDVVISSYSTSLIEASIANKAAVVLDPYPIPDPLRVDWHDLVVHIKTQSEFEDVCLNYADAGENSQLGQWARATMMACGDAIWNLADLLAQIVRGKIRRPPVFPRKIVTAPSRYPLPAWLVFEIRRMRWKAPEPNSTPAISSGHEKDVIDTSEIKQRITKWKQVLADYVPSELNSWLTV